jgi:hypothetical protein
MKKAVLSIFLFSFCLSKAQNYYDDAQLRQHINIEKRFGDAFSVSLEQQSRIGYNASTYTRGSLDVGFNFRINKNIRFCADYVFIEKRQKNGDFLPRHWYSGAIVLKKDIGRWKFLYRNLFQARYGYTSDLLNVRYYDRNKATVKYEATKRFSFYLSEELYIPVNSPQAKGLDRSRSYAGMNIKMSKRQVLELYFMYQVQLQKNDWFDQSNGYDNKLLKRYFVYGIGYSLVID